MSFAHVWTHPSGPFLWTQLLLGLFSPASALLTYTRHAMPPKEKQSEGE